MNRTVVRLIFKSALFVFLPLSIYCSGLFSTSRNPAVNSDMRLKLEIHFCVQVQHTHPLVPGRI